MGHWLLTDVPCLALYQHIYVLCYVVHYVILVGIAAELRSSDTFSEPYWK